MFGATQKRDAGIVRPLDDRAIGDRGVVEPAGCECHAVVSVRRAWMRWFTGCAIEPVDDFAAGRLPDALVGADMAEHLVEVPDAPGLAHDPRMQVQHHHPSGGRAVGIEPVEPLAPQQVDLVDGPAAVQMDVIVVEIRVHAERDSSFPGLRRHPVGLLVVAPVADVADALGREQVGRVRRLLEIGPGPADRARAGGPFDRLDRGADIVRAPPASDMPIWMMRRRVRPCAMNSAPRFCALLDQERVVVGDGLIEREGWRDAVFVQHGEDAEDPDPVAVFVVAVAADIGKRAGWLPVHSPSGPPIGLTGKGVLGGTSQSQCSRLTMTASATRALSGHRRMGG